MVKHLSYFDRKLSGFVVVREAGIYASGGRREGARASREGPGTLAAR